MACRRVTLVAEDAYRTLSTNCSGQVRDVIATPAPDVREVQAGEPLEIAGLVQCPPQAARRTEIGRVSIGDTGGFQRCRKPTLIELRPAASGYLSDVNEQPHVARAKPRHKVGQGAPLVADGEQPRAGSWLCPHASIVSGEMRAVNQDDARSTPEADPASPRANRKV